MSVTWSRGASVLIGNMGQIRRQHLESPAEAPGELLLTPDGAPVPLRPDGHLADVLDWSRQVARQLAAREGLVLGDTHWLIINAMRDYYLEFSVTPTLKLLKRSLKMRPTGWQIDDAVLAQLFPGNVIDQVARISGVPMPMRKDSPIQLGGQLDVAGKRYQLAPTGNLVNPHEWNEQVAERMAAREGLTLTPDHWEVLYFLRGFYFEYGIAPMVKILVRHLREEVGARKANRGYLYALFPGGPARQGSRFAGLPEPLGCID